MIGTAIVVFREVLEAALIVSIVMAACKGVAGRNFWVSCGLAGGILGAGIVAAFASSIAAAASGMGQELFNAAILFLAVIMLGWHNVWMSSHGRAMARELGTLGKAVMAGARPLYALAVVTGVAVLREGSETVLFVYSIAAGGNEGAPAMMAGGLLGLLLGVALGVGLYFGLLRIPLRHLFAVTNWMILLLAAGLASQAAAFLVQADVLPPLGSAIWDTSSLLAENSIPGKILHTLVGYVSRPDGIQILVYVATLAIIAALMQIFGKERRPDAKAGRLQPTATVVLAALLSSAVACEAMAEFKTRSPIVTYREFEFEHNGATTFDKSKSGKNNNQSYVNELEYSFIPNWMVGLEGEWEALSGENLTYEATTFENTFQLTEQGKYWADLGFFAEYSHAASRSNPESVKFGPLVQKELSNFLGTDSLHTLNVLVEKEFGRHRTDDTPLEIAWQSRLLLHPLFEPGFEYYGGIGDIESPGKPADQQHRIGPVLVGLYSFSPYGKIRYEVGYLFGLTRSTEDGAVRWRFEYEIAF